MKVPWRRVAQAVVLLLALGFLVALLRGQWQTLRAYDWELRPGWALASLGLLGAAWLLQIGLWRMIVSALGGVLPYGQAARIWFLSNITRYIPGNVWQYLSMAELAAECNVSRIVTLTSVVLHQVVSVAAGIALSGLYFAVAGDGVWLDRLRPGLYALPLILVFMHPWILDRTLNWVLKRLKRPPVQITLSWLQILGLLVLYTCAWMVMGLGFAALTRAITPIDWHLVPTILAAFVAAYVIGFITLLTPSGLGVREGALTLLLTVPLHSGVAAVVAIMARLWMVIGELIGVGVSLLFSRLRLPDDRRDITNGKESARTASFLPRLILVVLVLASTIGFSLIAIRQHDAHLTHKSDLGQMDLAIWNTNRGRFVQEVKDDYVSTRLTDHFEPIFAPVSVVFWLWDDVRALLVLQALALALAAFPVYGIARARFGRLQLTPLAPSSPSDVSNADVTRRGPIGTEWPALSCALVYLLFPAQQAANLYEFHAIPLAVPLILLAYWAIEHSRWWWFAVACGLLASVKEEAALLTLLLGVYVVLTQVWRSVSSKPLGRYNTESSSSRLPIVIGSLVAILSLVWFVVATFIIIPRHASSVYGVSESTYFQRYGELGNSVADIARSLITRPGLVWRIATEPLRVRYLVLLLAPAGFLSLLAPEILVLGSPLFAANILSSYAAQYSGEFHYSAPLAAYVVVAAIVGCDRLVRLVRGKRSSEANPMRRQAVVTTCVVAWMLAWGVGSQVSSGFTPLGSQFRWPAVTPHHQLLQRFVDQIPDSSSGSATSSLHPHFSHRERLYQFPNIGDAEWVLLDVSGTTDMHPMALHDLVRQMLDSGEWGVTDGADGYLLLERGQDNLELPSEFLDFAITDSMNPEVPVRVTFASSNRSCADASLQLLGYDVMDDPRWRTTRVRSYWQANQTLPDGLEGEILFLAEDGTIVDDSTQRPPVEPIWHPMSSWKTGQAAIVQTLPWYLPKRWGVAVRVAANDGADAPQASWVVCDASAGRKFDNDTWALLGVYERSDSGLDLVDLSAPGTSMQPLVATFGESLRLSGYGALPESIIRGSQVHLRLEWSASKTPQLDYTVFVHLRDPGGTTVSQCDSEPTWYGRQPTSTWQTDVRVLSSHTIAVPDHLPPGPYSIVLGLYDWQTGDRLPVSSTESEQITDELRLANLQVLETGHNVPNDDFCCAMVPECCVSKPQ